MEKEKIANSTIYNQVRTILVQEIVVALLLSLGANLILSFRQENEARDQSLISAAQVMANAPVLMDAIDANQANTYIKRTVKSVSSIDVLAVYDATGEPIAFYDLASGSHDVSQLAPLNKDIMDNLTRMIPRCCTTAMRRPARIAVRILRFIRRMGKSAVLRWRASICAPFAR